MDKGDIGLMRLNIDCSIILILLLFTTQQTSSEEPILRRQRELDAHHPVLPRDTRSATASTRDESLLTAPNSKYCAKLTDSVEYTTCMMCAVSNLQVQEDSVGNVCPLHKRPTGSGKATRGCIAGYLPVFSFEGCNFECVDSVSDLTECCPGYWGPHCSECLGGPLYPCSSHGKCDDGRNGTGECFCDDGYTGTACDICTGNSCSEKRMCIYNYDCRIGAYCEFRSGEDSYCQCLDGYHGDGVNCYPINPCMENSNHCPSSTSLCVYDGPNKYHCECKPGYSEFQVGCFQDECQDNNISCVTGAECATISTGEVLCQCTSGYVGNGLVCFGNVIERLEHLNGEGDLEGRLTQALLLLDASSVYQWLRDRGVFYTVFIPLDEAPEFANPEFATQLVAGLSRGSDDNAEVFLEAVSRIHIVPGYVDSHILKRINTVYNIAGQNIFVTQGSAKLTIGLGEEGDGEMARVIHTDLVASNGVIHIIDRVLLPLDDVSTRAQGSMLDVLSSYTNLGIFTGMIKSSPSLRLALDSPEVSYTVFAIPDDALLQFTPDKASLLLLSGKWQSFVRYFIYEHLAPEKLSTNDLIKAGVFRNYRQESFEIRVSENGCISVPGIGNITSPDIAATNGVIHIVHSIFDSSSFFQSPEICFKNQTEEMIQECCDGFYSPACLRCSGCYWGGQCDDGIHGSGSCICESAYDGVDCDLCKDNTMFGWHCNQSCSCIQGECSNGPWGTGHCKFDTCLSGFMGEDCHLQTTPCGPEEIQCHAHSNCVIEEGLSRCVCNRNYTGNGTDCVPINPCTQSSDGPCDSDVADCIFTGPGAYQCACKEGFTGRNMACTPRDRCLVDNGGCHQHAMCLHEFTLDLTECTCNFGFEGNGYQCEPINACLRPHDCDVEAECESTGHGTYECICPPGWEVDKRNCYSNLALELSAISDARLFWELIQSVSLDGYLSHTDQSLGVFVPTRHALQYINTTTGGALRIQRIKAYFVRSHMFLMNSSQRYLNQTLPSLQPGEDIEIDGPYGNLSIISGHVSRVENATNGLIFLPSSFTSDYWIKRFLEVQRKLDHLTPSSGDVQDYSLAWQVIQSSRLLPNMTKYTIFLPDNDAMSSIDWSSENEFLEHHLVTGKTLYYQNLTEELDVISASGQHIHFFASSEQVSVDMIPIEAPDILLLPSGIAHGITGVLSASLRDGMCEDRRNGGCSHRATCLQKTSSMLQCQCVHGYHGNGTYCELNDPCYHDNGGCHFRATCIPVNSEERTCSCNYGYLGDGIVCIGSILEELWSIPEASLFVDFLQYLDSPNFLMRTGGYFTLFVPTNVAITAFLQDQVLPEEWHEYTYLLTQYVLYHVIAGSHMTMNDLHNHTTLGVMNGQDLGLATNQNDTLILGSDVRLIGADHNASNGIIHIIDSMLIPSIIYEWPQEQDMAFSSDNHGRRPHPDVSGDLEILGTSHNISTFLQLLQLTPMFQELFSDGPPRPGHGGSPPRRPHPRITGSHDPGRMGERGQSGDMSGERSSGIGGSVNSRQRPRGMHQDDRGRRYQSKGNDKWRKGRMQQGSTLRLDDVTSMHQRRGEAAGSHFIEDRERGQGNRISNGHGLQRKRSLDRPEAQRGPPRRHIPHGIRHGGFHRDSTVFAPTDEAFMKLPPGKLDELTDPDNRLLLQEFIAHHVIPDERFFNDLWPRLDPYTVPSLQGSDLRLSIIGQGKLFVNERSRVIGVGLEFEGGVLFPVSEVISLPRIDGRCDVIETQIRIGRCKKCGSHNMCSPLAEPVGAEQPGCRFRDGWYSSVSGCRRECQFNEVTRACCPGYYGPSCQECPGGSTYPCNNHGHCNEGYDNDGMCTCNEGFTGTACERCLPGYYGPSCKKCRCSRFSICYGQSGECFCAADQDGRYCENIPTVIPSCDPPCHQNAVCRPGNRCLCSPQYHGDGFTCNTVNKCFMENGGCSIHASCTHNAFAINVNCTCHDSFYGDGIVCLPVNLCEKNNGGCHPNAICRFRGPNLRSCICRPPYWGDGLECHPPVTSCLTNNGGCSHNAHCQQGQDGGPIECTCYSGYVGDGLVCNGNLYDTLASQPDFQYFFKMVMQLANKSRAGERLVKDLLKSNDPLTIFVPLDPASSGLTFYPSQILLHVVHGRWSKEDLLDEGEDDEDLETWSGDELDVDVHYDKHHQAIVTIEDVPIVKYGMEATNGIIHMIEAPLPIWSVMDYIDDGQVDHQMNESEMRMGWNSSSRIFASVAVPLGLLAFITVAVLYWIRGMKIRELSQSNQVVAQTTPCSVQQGTEAGRPNTPPSASQSPPVSPVSSVDQGDIQYSEFDQLMSEETGENLPTHLETRC
nr:stabilin-2-like isoform X1 [Lytechinus pictus]